MKVVAVTQIRHRRGVEYPNRLPPDDYIIPSHRYESASASFYSFPQWRPLLRDLPYEAIT